MDEATNRSNGSDQPVRVMTIYASGKVSHRDVTKRAPTGWGRAGAHALPDEAPKPREKDPRKVAAGKARAAQAKRQREEAEARKAQAKPASPDAMVVISFRATPAQKLKFEKLGRGKWARARIDAAVMPAPKGRK